MKATQLEWLGKPLAVPTRRRLEVALGAVLSLAGVVVLSRTLQPSPEKLASRVPAAMVAPPAPAELPRIRPATPQPKVAPSFAAAVGRNDLDAVKQLYVPKMALDGMLAVAADGGSVEMTRFLLDHGADVHESESSENAPLLLADAHPEVVALLLERGAFEPSLAAAAHAGARAAVTRLLASRTPVDPVDASPLAQALSSVRASDEDRTFIVEALLAAGADPNREVDYDSPEGRPITVAVNACESTGEEGGWSTARCLPLVKRLMAKGARADGTTLSAAAIAGDAVLDAVLTRIEPGATAEALAMEIAPAKIPKIAAHGVDWGWHDGEDESPQPLVAAVKRRDIRAVRALIAAGAPVDRHYKDGGSAVAAALDALDGELGSDPARIVEVLLAHGADPNRRLPDGRTPLLVAAEAGDVRVIDNLLDRGARVNELVLEETALDGAMERSHVPAARVLHARGGRRAPGTEHPF